MRRNLLQVLVALVCAVSPLTSSGAVPLGVIVPDGAAGEETIRAAQLANDDLKQFFNLVVRPGPTAEEAIRSIESLATSDKVATIIGVARRFPDSALRERLQQHSEVAYLSLSAFPMPISGRSPTYFHIGTTVGKLATLAERYVVDLHPKRVAVVGFGNASSGIEQRLKAKGIDVISGPSEIRPQQDLAASLGQAANLRPETILATPSWAIQDTTIGRIAQVTRATQVVTYSLDGLGSTKSVDINPSDVYVAAAADPSRISKDGTSFVQRFAQKWQAKPTNGYGLQAYVAVQVIYQALQGKSEGARQDRERLIKALQERSFDTLVGKVQFSRVSGDAPYASEAVWRMSNTESPIVQSSGTGSCNCDNTSCCDSLECCNKTNGKCPDKTC